MEKPGEEAAALERARRQNANPVPNLLFLFVVVCVLLVVIGFQITSVATARGERDEALVALAKLQEGCKLSLLQTVARVSLRDTIVERFIQEVMDWKARKP